MQSQYAHTNSLGQTRKSTMLSSMKTALWANQASEPRRLQRSAFLNKPCSKNTVDWGCSLGGRTYARSWVPSPARPHMHVHTHTTHTHTYNYKGSIYQLNCIYELCIMPKLKQEYMLNSNRLLELDGSNTAWINIIFISPVSTYHWCENSSSSWSKPSFELASWLQMS
jgi:hypothetical protein